MSGEVRDRFADWLGWASGRFQNSLFTKLMAGFLAALVLVIAGSAYLDTRLTRSALQQQARDTLQGELEVLRTTLSERQSALVTGLRNASQVVAFYDLLSQEHRASLINELSPLQRSMQLDVLGVLLGDGRLHVSLGAGLRELPAEAMDDLLEGPAHHLLPTVDGRYVQVGAVPVGDVEQPAVLFGGYLFDDAAAFEFRLLGGNDVLLVADGRLVGSTLADRPDTPPGFDRRADGPAVIVIDGAETFVDYVPIFASAGTWEAEGAVGVAILEPLARLDGVLVRNRLIGVGLLGLVVVLLALYVARQFAQPLLRLTDTARRIADGDGSATFEADSKDEIGYLAETLEQMRRAGLDYLRLVRDQSRELRHASERIVGAQDEERRRIANDLHDGLQRQLVLLRARLGLYRQLRGEDPDGASALLAELEQDVEAALSGLRETSQRIFPAILQDRGLDGGLNSLAGRAPISVDLTTHPDPLPRLEEKVEVNAYLLASEALTNIVKHAEAQQVRIVAWLYPDALVLDVVDDGCGFDPATVDGDGGLRHLRDRVGAVGGRLDVDSRPGRGTTVRAVFPLATDLERPGSPPVSPAIFGGSRERPRPVGSDPRSP